jgi:hypothetical protein
VIQVTTYPHRELPSTSEKDAETDREAIEVETVVPAKEREEDMA